MNSGSDTQTSLPVRLIAFDSSPSSKFDPRGRTAPSLGFVSRLHVCQKSKSEILFVFQGGQDTSPAEDSPNTYLGGVVSFLLLASSLISSLRINAACSAIAFSNSLVISLQHFIPAVSSKLSIWH